MVGVPIAHRMGDLGDGPSLLRQELRGPREPELEQKHARRGVKHYGNLVTSMRMNGLVPRPGSQPLPPCSSSWRGCCRLRQRLLC